MPRSIKENNATKLAKQIKEQSRQRFIRKLEEILMSEITKVDNTGEGKIEADAKPFLARLAKMLDDQESLSKEFSGTFKNMGELQAAVQKSTQDISAINGHISNLSREIKAIKEAIYGVKKDVAKEKTDETEATGIMDKLGKMSNVLTELNSKIGRIQKGLETASKG